MRISNPGCYATNIQLLLAPLLPYISQTPTVFGISGYSGAGTKKGSEPKVTPEELGSTVRPYALTDHIHEREVGHHLQRLVPGLSGGFEVAFVPAVAPWFSGIIATASVPLKESLSASELHQLYEDKYGGEKLLRWSRTGIPSVSQAADQHGWQGGGLQVHSQGKRVVVVGVLDNLLKGAATQCMQNLNLALGFDEFCGIPDLPNGPR